MCKATNGRLPTQRRAGRQCCACNAVMARGYPCDHCGFLPHVYTAFNARACRILDHLRETLDLLDEFLDDPPECECTSCQTNDNAGVVIYELTAVAYILRAATSRMRLGAIRTTDPRRKLAGRARQHVAV